jgi:hypothetical protein
MSLPQYINLLLICLSTCFLCNCQNNSVEHLRENQIVEAKWLLYALTYSDSAVPMDYYHRNNPKRKSIECDYRDVKYFTKNDTVAICFSMFYGIDSLLYVALPFDFYGVVFVKNKIQYPLIAEGIKFSVFENKDSSSMYIDNRKREFEIYLRNYKGELSAWLRSEAKNRGIL